MGDHVAAKPTNQPKVDREVEGAAPPGEVLIQLSGGIVGATWELEDPGADRVGELVQHDVVILGCECEADDTDLGRCDEELAERAVEVAECHAEQPVAVRVPGEAGEHEVVVTLPPEALLAGDFGLAVCLWNDAEILDLQEPALGFSVEPGPSVLYRSSASRKGHVHIPCAWRVAALVGAGAR